MFQNILDAFWYGDGKFLVIAFVIILTLFWMYLEWENAEFHPLDQEIFDPFDEIDEHYFTIPRD